MTNGTHLKSSAYGPCGLFCGACGATDCDGCSSGRIDDWVRQCKFRNCAKDRNIDFCCQCSDFPCQDLDSFMNDKWPHHWTMQPNLKYIQDHGLKKWLQAQKQEWSCKSCGARINWYQKICTCGKRLEAWELPE